MNETPDPMPNDDMTPGSARAPAGGAANRRRLWTGAIAAVAVIIWLYGLWPYQHGHLEERVSVLKGLYVLVTNPAGREWIFCLFVPLIAGFLVYLRRGGLRKLPVDGSAWGIAMMAFGLFIYWLGYRADTRFLGFASAQILLAALIVWMLGWQAMRWLLFPWIFFAFTWPFPPLEEIVAFPLRVFAARSSTFILNVLGVDCVREGTAVISAGDPAAGLQKGALFQLDVDSPCSGIRSLFSLVMISVFYGYLALKGTWQRLALFASAIPLALAGNVVRMVLLAYGCVFFGTEFAVGTEYPSTYHEMSGLAVFAVALAGMFSISRILEGSGRRRSSAGKSRSPAREIPPPGRKILPYWRSAAAILLASAAILACHLTPAPAGLSEPGVKPALPASFAAFWGQEIPATKAERDGLLVYGVALSRFHYQDAAGRSAIATVIIGGPDGRTLHRPEVCLPGQGWKITGSRTASVDAGAGPPIPATLLTVSRSEPTPDGALVSRTGFNLYFYVGHDRTAASYNEHILTFTVDGIFRNLYHRWSMVSLFATVSIGEASDPLAEAQALDLLQEIARNVIPAIKSGDW